MLIKLKRSKKKPRLQSRRKTLPKGCRWLVVDGCDEQFLVDKKIYARLNKLSWNFDKIKKKPRALFRKKYMFLHKVVCMINGVDWEKVKFLNDDPTDCRFGNLRPFDITKDRKSRRRRDNSTGLTGVSYVKRLGKFTASISVGKERKWLGNYSDIRDAAQAYADAWNKAHPNKRQIKVAGRGEKVFYLDEKED